MTYQFKETSSSAVRRVRQQGLALPERPDHEQPQLPADITEIHIEDLMVKFGEVNSWLDFIEVQLAAAEIDEKHEDGKAEEMLATIQIENKNEKSVALMKAIALQDKEYNEMRGSAERAYAYRKIMATMQARLARQQFLISRELTRRQYAKEI